VGGPLRKSETQAKLGMRVGQREATDFIDLVPVILRPDHYEVCG